MVGLGVPGINVYVTNAIPSLPLGISPSRLLVHQGIPPWPLYLEALVVIPFVALKCFRWAGSLSCLEKPRDVLTSDPFLVEFLLNSFIHDNFLPLFTRKWQEVMLIPTDVGIQFVFLWKVHCQRFFVTPQRRFRVPIYVWNDIPWTFYPNLWDNEIIGFSAQVGKIEEVPHGFRVFFWRLH